MIDDDRKLMARLTSAAVLAVMLLDLQGGGAGRPVQRKETFDACKRVGAPLLLLMPRRNLEQLQAESSWWSEEERQYLEGHVRGVESMVDVYEHAGKGAGAETMGRA